MKMQFNKDNGRLVVLMTNAERVDFGNGKVPIDESPSAERGREIARKIYAEHKRIRLYWPKPIEIRVLNESFITKEKFQPDELNQTIQEMAREAAKNKDALISGAITKRLGSGWILRDIAHRIFRGIKDDANGITKTETWFLDGERIIEFYPSSLIHSDEDHRMIATLSTPYKVY